ncbi:MAG TPA: MATE family efflux transporter [Pseudogracilibacillus sp.]|nr:MATE family efflux transporter [Pseudogracilibacillus sp.]
MASVSEKLGTQSVVKSFFEYFLPTLFGMMLMSVNIVIDGIFVGNGVGPVALASVNIAVPTFSVIMSISLMISIGGGTLYSISLGRNDSERAQKIFTMSLVYLIIVMITVSLAGYFNMEALAKLFGANQETLPYVMDYMGILFIFSLALAGENFVSVFIRNDGDPQLAMIGLVTTALLNIGLNYWMIFILKMEVLGAALATVIATIAGVLVYAIHFLKKSSNLKLVRFKWNWRDILNVSGIGFPSFLAEAATGVFVMGYNIALAFYSNTDGLSAFSVINYLYTFMFFAFIGIGSTIQPMISYYYGAKKYDHIKQTVRLGEAAGLGLGLLFIAIGYLATDYLVAIFGITSPDIVALSSEGIKLFFLGYIFMGINFVYMTYYQSIGQIKPSIGITLFRGFILLGVMLLVLPPLFGIKGIWLALPTAEAVMAIILIIFARRGVMKRHTESVGF